MVSGEFPPLARAARVRLGVHVGAVAVTGICTGSAAAARAWPSLVFCSVLLIVCLVILLGAVRSIRQEHYALGVVTGLHLASHVTRCDHQWERWRDEKTEDLGWRCARCATVRT